MRALLVLCFALTLFLPSGALAEKRIALLIGNDKYSAEVGPLRNPGNDVTLIARALRAIGFAESDIRIVRNAGRIGALQAIGDYADKLASAGNDAIGFFYYSGHGAANKRNSKNYLIPVGVKKLNRSLWYNSIALDDIIAQLADTAPNAAHFVIFDACRNRLNLTTKGGKGFVPVSPRRGMLIAFSTDPGETASDAGDGSGPYARALAHELRKPGLDHNDLFQNVKESVFKETGVQVPWERNGLLSRVYLSGEKQPQSAKPVAAPKPPLSEAAREWELVKHSKSSAVLKAFKSKHKDPIFQALADERLKELQNRDVAALVKPGKPAKPADEVKPAIGIFPAKPEAALKRKFFKPEMVRVPGGSFEMGCRKNDGNKGWCYELIHRVTIKAFEIGKYEVTNEEWDACVARGGCNGHKPNDHGWGRGKRPVIDVSWDDAQAYVTWLSGKTGKKYRLPSEAEWEYAARAGSTTPFWWGSTINPAQANYNGEYTFDGGKRGENRRKTVAVDSFKPNAFGLYNVHGNVSEWVEDCWHFNYKDAPPTDGSAWLRANNGNCDMNVFRGGSWYDAPMSLRSARRNTTGAVDRYSTRGFRIAKTLAPDALPSPHSLYPFQAILTAQSELRREPRRLGQSLLRLDIGNVLTIISEVKDEFWYRARDKSGLEGFVLKDKVKTLN